jgi:hypothetical protein
MARSALSHISMRDLPEKFVPPAASSLVRGGIGSKRYTVTPCQIREEFDQARPKSWSSESGKEEGLMFIASNFRDTLITEQFGSTSKGAIVTDENTKLG